MTLWRSIAALVVAISAWSLSPLLIVKSSHLARSPVAALYAISIGAFLALLGTSFSRTLRLPNLIRVARAEKTLGKAFAVGTAAFIVYPVLYFSAIQSGPPALANLVNYLWPIVGIAIVARFRRETRSLEILLAAGFGLSGAALAIIDSNPLLTSLGHARALLPFALAAAGALAYGSVSGYMNISQTDSGSSRLYFLTLALLMAGGVAVVLLLGIGVVSASAAAPRFAHNSALPLLIYAALLPCAHLCWLTAVQDRRVPGLTSAFLVPVIATTVLALTVSGEPGRKLFAALTLVVCGVAFSAARERGIPVVFAVSLAALGSIEVSQSLAYVNAHSADAAGSFFSQLLVGLVAIFDGFVLSNAIGRYARLREVCARFYERAAMLLPYDANSVTEDLDTLDSAVLASGKHGRMRALDAQPRKAGSLLVPEWSQVDLALADNVSRYEWLVLILGSGGVIVSLYAFALTSTSLLTLILRAFATAVVIGVLFAIQDYDRNRPEQVLEVLLLLRRSYDLPVRENSALSVEIEGRKQIARSSMWMGAGLGVLTAAVIASIAVNIH